MNRLSTILPALLMLTLLTSCANYKLNYEHGPEDWSAMTPDPNLTLSHTMYLIGDAGYSREGEVAPAIQLLQQKLRSAPKNSSVIFLGDNIYPHGLPSKDHPDRAEAQYRLDVQLETLRDFPGKAFMIAGNHDWGGDGLKGVKRQEDYVEDYLDDHGVWFPEHGCGGPDVVEINNDLVIIFIDSEWWLTDWDAEPAINDGCESKSRENFLYLFEEAVKKHRNKNIVIAQHHPLYSNGSHGGYFMAHHQLFPLTDVKKNLWIPLPVIGTVYTTMRATVGTREDLAFQPYKDLKAGLLATARKNGNFIFVSGHEHALQYFEADDQYFVVSGAGSKQTAVRGGKGSLFTYGGNGISILRFYDDGTAWLEFWRPLEGDPEGELIYRHQVRGSLPLKEIEIPTEFLEYEEHREQINYVLYEGKKPKGRSHRFFWGDLYRDEYFAEVEVPVLDVATFQGGLSPVKRGGGYQTNSLRLVDSLGRQYVMRGLQKDATRIVPYPFNKTVAKDIFADQFASAHPYAAFVVPDLADAADVYHTNPKLYYVPKQPALGTYNDQFGGELYLVEERPDKEWSELESFGQASDFLSTADLAEELREDHEHRVDQISVIRARLFDQLLGDWDRHDDQWRWGEFKDGEWKTFRPVPRDRDQVFSKYDGVMSGILRQTIPFLRQLRVYEEDIPKMQWVNYHSRHFDHSFLNEPEWADWEREAKKMQAALTDELIENSIRQLPPAAFALSGEEIIRKFKGRRDRLLDIARDLYLVVSKKVDVVGTDKKDYFEVVRLNNEETVVRLYDPNKEDKRHELIYERTFKSSETKEIILYGLGGEDEFELAGQVEEGILIRCVGGQDEDTFIDHSIVSGLSKKTRFYDSKKENHLERGTEAADKTTNRREFNIYNRRALHYEYNYAMPIPVLGFQPDDGFFAGLTLQFIRYGFQRSPYAQSHTVSGRYAFATSGYKFEYNGEYIYALGKFDFLLDGRFHGPLFTINFFGLGNETGAPTEAQNEFDYNRVRQQLYGLYPGLRLRFKRNSFVSFQLLAESTKTEPTDGRFVALTDEVNPEVFDNQYFAGGELKYNLTSTDHPQLPTRGVNFNLSGGYRLNLQETDRDHVYFSTDLAWYIALAGGDRLVLATRVGYQKIFGEFEFFQSRFLGGSDNLRGYRQYRFAGDGAFFHNTDLRLKLFNVENYYLPFAVGLYAGYDYGRVWYDQVESDIWHKGYGGGIWLSPFGAGVISAGYFRSKNDQRVEVKGGFLF